MSNTEFDRLLANMIGAMKPFPPEYPTCLCGYSSNCNQRPITIKYCHDCQTSFCDNCWLNRQTIQDSKICCKNNNIFGTLTYNY